MTPFRAWWGLPANDANPLNLQKWIAHVFDHPVTEPVWYWSDDPGVWEDQPEHILSLVADTFEQSGELLSRFSDAQIDQGFWFLWAGPNNAFTEAFLDNDVPIASRLRALRSFVPLFQQVMAVRCSDHLSHLDEPGANPLNSSCYMWWDIAPIRGKLDDSERAEFDTEVLTVLQRLVAIQHNACHESALHGLNHWQPYYPEKIGNVIDNFLIRTPKLRPELINYALLAKAGNAQ
jgi:hypothetical protein